MLMYVPGFALCILIWCIYFFSLFSFVVRLSSLSLRLPFVPNFPSKLTTLCALYAKRHRKRAAWKTLHSPHISARRCSRRLKKVSIPRGDCAKLVCKLRVSTQRTFEQYEACLNGRFPAPSRLRSYSECSRMRWALVELGVSSLLESVCVCFLDTYKRAWTRTYMHIHI